MTPSDGDRGPGSADRGSQSLTTAGYDPIIIQRSRGSGEVDYWLDQQAGPAESGFDIARYWHILLKHRLVVLGVFIASISVGIAATLLMTPIYTASTTLQIDRQAAKVVDVESVTPAEVAFGEEFFQTQYGLLRSVSLAARTVDGLGLARDNNFLELMGMAPQPSAAARRTASIKALTRNLGVQPVRGSRLVAVTFNSPNPELSARVANGVADNFIEYSLERRYEAASYARRFLESRLQQVKARLEESEKQLVAYASQQQIVNIMPQTNAQTGGAEQTASQSLTAADLGAMNSALAIAKGERIRTEQRWRQAQRADPNSLPEALQNPTIQALSQRRANLQADYQDKLSIYKPDFPAMQQLTAQINEIDRQINTIVETIRQSIRGEYEVAARQESSLAAQVSGLKSGVMDLRSRSIQYNILQREVDTSRTLYDGLLQRYKEVGVAGGVGSNNVSVVDQATAPERPSRPKPLVNLAIAAGLGLLLGGLAALLLELLDESIHSPEDVESKLGVTLLGAVPTLARGATLEEALNDPRSAISEAYYSVRTALQFSTASGAPDILLVTSTRASEGKSTTARSLAGNFASLGLKVLLIDADLRNPSLHKLMGADNSAGLSNLLAGISTLNDVVLTSSIPGLSFVPCGPLPPNPAELLAGTRLRGLLAEARTQYDMVVLDGPPILGLADAPILANVASGTLLVIEAGGTRRGQALGALKRLNQGQRGRVLGAILTKFSAKNAGYGYGYGYGYAYQYDYGSRPQLQTRK